MADNILVTPGVGATIAADEITTRNSGTVPAELAQRVKVGWGIDGTFNDANASTPLPVTVSNASMPVTGTFWQATQPVSGTVSVSGSVAVTGTFWQATQPVSLASVPALVAGSAIIGKVGIDQTTPGTTNLVAAGQSGTWNITNISGTVSLPTGAATAANQSTLNTNIGSSADAVVANGVAGSIASYLRTIKDAATDTTTVAPVKIDQTTVGTTNAVSLGYVGSTAAASGNGVTGAGSLRVTIASDNTAFSVNATSTPATTAHAMIPAPSTYRVLSAAASTNGANIKGSAGTVKGLQGYNAKASAVYLKLYNKASSPTVGTDTPVKTIYLPATAAFAFDFGTGVSFATGISIALTGAGADADTTALSSGDILALNVDYH